MSNVINVVGGGIPEGDYVWEKHTLNEDAPDELQSYVVSKNETKYPNNGIQGNFWYKKIESKVALPGQQIFTSSGTFTVPLGVTSVDVFLVGGGGGAGSGGGGGGYTKTYKDAITGYRDGDAISVTAGQEISIIVGAGGAGGSAGSGYNGADGGYSEFWNSTYRANGGQGGRGNPGYGGGAGGSGGGASGEFTNVPGGVGGTDGVNGASTSRTGGTGQGHTTRAFGELTGILYAGGGGGAGANPSGLGGAGGSGGGGKGTDGGISNAVGGTDNTGGGGGGGNPFPSGGSGIVIVRWGGYSE